MVFKYFSKDPARTDPFTMKKNFPFFFIYRINSKTTTYQNQHCANFTFSFGKTQKHYRSKLKTKNKIFTVLPQSHFLSKLRRCFSFMEVVSRKRDNSCRVLFKIDSTHMATFALGIGGCIEFPVTTKTSSVSLEWSKYTHLLSSSSLPPWYNWTNRCSLSRYAATKQFLWNELNSFELISIKITKLLILYVMYNPLKKRSTSFRTSDIQNKETYIFERLPLSMFYS